MKAFGIEKFKGLLVAGSFTVLANYAIGVSDSILSGNLIGEKALAGVNLIGPWLSASAFLAGLISTGCGTLYSIAMGKCNVLRARQFYMQAIWSALIFGGAMSLAMLFGREIFVSLMGATAEISAYAYDYMGWVSPLCVEGCVMGIMVSLGYADGDAKLCTLSYAVLFSFNVIISFAAIKLGMGVKGCALGSVVSELLGIAVLSAHFLKASNTFRPVRHFSLPDTWRMACASFGDAASFLCDGLLFLFLNMFVIAHYGSRLLPVVAAITALWGLLEFFNGIGVAVQPIVTVYHGERNTKAMRTVMNAAMLVSLIEGAAIMTVFLICPQLVGKIVGISDHEIMRTTTFAVRCMCAGVITLAFAGLFNSYYMFIEKPLLAGAVTFLCYLIMPVAGVAVGSGFGESQMWAGLGIGPTAGVVFASVFIIAIEGWRMFPLLIPFSRDKKLCVFNLTLTDGEIVDASRKIADILKAEKQPQNTVVRASLMAEEVLMAVKDRNAGRKVLGEVTLDMNEGVTMTMRDDGEIFDITDADAKVSSLRSYLVASMMQYHDGRMNLVTTGFNRNVFKF